MQTARLVACGCLIYNDRADKYNRLLEKLPAKIVGRLLGFQNAEILSREAIDILIRHPDKSGKSGEKEAICNPPALRAEQHCGAKNAICVHKNQPPAKPVVFHHIGQSLLLLATRKRVS